MRKPPKQKPPTHHATQNIGKFSHQNEIRFENKL
jgi:hypothetical protein